MVSLGAALKRKKRDDNEVDEKDTSPSCKLPLDLQQEIMTRLPAKSVFKFRCVSKMWSSITRTPNFINSHYAMSSATRSRFAIVLRNSSLKNKRSFIFSSSYEEEKSSCLVTNLDMVIPSLGFSYCASLYSFIGCSGPFLVCNPKIKKFTTFPGNGQCTWFGYDPVGAQLKALTVQSKPNDDFLVHEFFSLGLGGGESCNKFVSPRYYTATRKICIGGFLYQSAWTARSATPNKNPVIVCFDLRYEKISFIKPPEGALCLKPASILIDYKGKLASIARKPHSDEFDLWILEDAEKHDWSKQTFELPYPLGKMYYDMNSPGTNKAGEIIFAPKYLPGDARPFYIFYYNVQRKDLRRVRLLGLADDQDFRQVNGISQLCGVYIFPKHVEIITSL